MATNGVDKPRKLKRRSPAAIRRTILNALIADLSIKEKLFCQEYIKDFNQTRAYQVSHPDVQYNTAMTAGSRWMRRPKIRKYITLLVNRISEENHLEADRVVREIATLAFSNMKDFARWGHTFLKIKPSREMTREEAACIKKISRRETKMGEVNIDFELYDKYRGLDMLARYFNLLKPEFDDEDATQRAVNIRNALEGMFSSVPLIPATKEDEEKEDTDSE